MIAMTEAEVEPSAPPPPARPRHRLNTDRVLSLSAMAVGVCTLFLTPYQTHLTRQQQSASVLPSLAFGITSTRDGAYLTLRNDGVGPGRLEAVRIHHRGRLFAMADAPPSWIEGKAHATDKAVIGIEYSSVFGDRWRIRSDQLVPQPF